MWASQLLPEKSGGSEAASPSELVKVLQLLMTTLELGGDAILVTDPRGGIIHANQKFLAMWNLAGDLTQYDSVESVAEILCESLLPSHDFQRRLSEILATPSETTDHLEFQNGQAWDCSTRVLEVEGEALGRAWTFRDVSERNEADIVAHRLAAIVASSDDATSARISTAPS
jgi:PAS domain-containing protein